MKHRYESLFPKSRGIARAKLLLTEELLILMNAIKEFDDMTVKNLFTSFQSENEISIKICLFNNDLWKGKTWDIPAKYMNRRIQEWSLFSYSEDNYNPQADVLTIITIRLIPSKAEEDAEKKRIADQETKRRQSYQLWLNRGRK
ncbi:MAG TPA: hypothetical protein DEB10_00465 [Ruminococcaceae bacterium]|nr:hypothetical protein [Oscillospiraceae bacterium]